MLRENELRINYSKSSFTFSTSAFAVAHTSVTHSSGRRGHRSFCLRRINLLFKAFPKKQSRCEKIRFSLWRFWQVSFNGNNTNRFRCTFLNFQGLFSEGWYLFLYLAMASYISMIKCKYTFFYSAAGALLSSAPLWIWINWPSRLQQSDNYARSSKVTAGFISVDTLNMT